MPPLVLPQRIMLFLISLLPHALVPKASAQAWSAANPLDVT